MTSIADDHLYVCEYRGRETVSDGNHLHLWNEGLDDEIEPRRDLGRIYHSWTVTEDDGRVLRTEHVTDEGCLVVVPRNSSLERTYVAEDASVTERVPSSLYTVSHVKTAVKTARSEAAAPGSVDVAALSDLEARTREIVAAINDGVDETLYDRYEQWRNEAAPYPQGENARYDIPLDASWKRRVLLDSGVISGAQASFLASVEYPAAMTVEVSVDYPDEIARQIR